MSDDGFLARWSQRKRRVAAEAAERAATEAAQRDLSAQPAAPAPENAEREGPPSVSDAEAETMSDAEILERLDLPAPDSILDTEQARAFLRAGVPSRLKRLALRRMWAVTPDSQLACFDGLRDYADDYTDAAVGAGAVRSSYVVGQGLRAHVEALARKAEEEAERAAAEDAAAGDAVQQPESDAETVEPGDAVAEGEAARDAEAAGGGRPARPHVRPPDSRRSAALQQEKDRFDTELSDLSPNPDEIALGQRDADAAARTQFGAAATPPKPRRMVFRFDES